MRKIFLAWLIVFCVTVNVQAQFTDNFSDGDFTSNPAWAGSSSDWIVNTSSQLQSNNTVANSTFYITTASTLATTAQWEFVINLTFNTSSTNYVDVFLTASANDLTAATTNGYFVRIGNTADEIALYKKVGATSTKIIDGVDASTNSSSNTIKVKVTRDAANEWKLYRDLTGGNNFFNEGTITDNTFNTSSFFGILVKQSTVASFAQRHFFDDITVQAYVPDATPPAIVSATATSSLTVDVLFNEAVDNTSSQVAANYVANNSIGAAATAVIDGVNTSLVHLSFSNSFPNGSNNTLTINAVQDVNGNTLNNGTANFSFYTPQQYDIVIDEIIADPTPQVALPNSEWIELRNTTAFPISLAGWKIGDAGGISGVMPDTILRPDSFVIVCTGSAVPGLLPFGKTISVSSFPSLDNTGELLYLMDANGNIIHSVNYNISWYQNELKQDGGWTLEMVDTKNPCSGFSNWKASSDLTGGTPGRKNSVDAVNADATAPKLLKAYAIDDRIIELVFDEPLNTSSAAIAANYVISDGIGTPLNANAIAPSYDKVSLDLNSPLLPGKVYTITVSNITDCMGNVIGSSKTAKVGLNEVADSLDIVINEILFNPPSNGFDYVEIYNRSNKIINLQQTYIANRNTTGVISSITQLSAEPYLLFPQDFMVITENADWVKNNFITKNPGAFTIVGSLPSFSDDEGTVIILNAQGKIMDELKYKDDWHFKLLDNKEGVALERIDYSAATQLESNWHSAATNVNYGTPTYQNSQFRINDGVQGEVKLSPEIVSPDNDGQDDFATIDYDFPEAGYVASITIFDASGRPVRYLQRNALCGTSGSFRWDGLGERNQQLATGVYVVLTEVFNLSGKKKQFKKTIVVARRN
ncbi:MAG: lamin tail domain-containing protein [Bacteroidota bacterium]